MLPNFNVSTPMALEILERRAGADNADDRYVFSNHRHPASRIGRRRPRRFFARTVCRAISARTTCDGPRLPTHALSLRRCFPLCSAAPAIWAGGRGVASTLSYRQSRMSLNAWLRGRAKWVWNDDRFRLVLQTRRSCGLRLVCKPGPQRTRNPLVVGDSWRGRRDSNPRPPA